MFQAVRNMFGRTTGNIDQQAPAADVEVIAARTGMFFVVDMLVINWDPHAATVFFESSTATKIFGTLDLLAAGGTITIYDPGIKTAVSENLTVTTVGASSKVSVFVRGHYEGKGA